MASKVDICNQALGHIGQDPISSIDEESKNAKTCKLWYDKTRNEILVKYPWSFAMTRAELARLASAPAFGYDYEYQLPTDCLRPWKLYTASGTKITDWIQEGRLILCDQDEAYLRYIKKADTEGNFDVWFEKAFTLALAVNICMTIKTEIKLKAALLEEFLFVISEAYLLNIIEGDQDDAEINDDTDWVKEGR